MALVDVDDLVGLSEIADEHGISLATLNTWKFRYSDHVPAEVKMLGRRPLYLRDDWHGFFDFVRERGLWAPATVE
jgi:hypothetical protein